MAALAPRFADPELERAFLRTERDKRGRAIRALITIAVATLLGYIVINPLHFPPEGVAAYVRAAGSLTVLMTGFWLLTRSQFYLDQPWIDLPLFVAMGALSAEYGVELQARVGIHVGPVVGGVIGSRRLAYDYWGDTMNVAARLQGVAPANGIAVSEAAYLQVSSELDFKPRMLVLKHRRNAGVQRDPKRA